MNKSFDEITKWLIGHASEYGDLRVLTEQLVERLDVIGFPVERLNLGVLAVHPEMAGYAVMWEKGMGAPIEVPIRREDTQKATYLDSPIRYVVDHQVSVDFDLSDPDAQNRFPVLQEFRDKGFTQYLGFPLPYGEGGTAILTLCTRLEGGFSQSHTVGIQQIFPVLRLLIDVAETRRLARTVLRTYLGKDTGERVLSGEIVRGAGERIQAALWFCDLRDYTSMTAALGSFAMIDVMNQFFDCMADAIWAEDGEILKFMGDAMLAVFRIRPDRGPASAAQAAFRASQAAIDSLSAISSEREQRSEPELRAGVSLHLGSVVYGNIGAASRLDFTVMGHAVNLVARIQSLNGSTGEPILFSREIADHVGDCAESVGVHSFKGVPVPVEVYRLKKP